MKTTLALSSLFIILMFSSCQKGIDDVPNTGTTDSVSFLVKTYTEDVAASGENSVTTYNLSYDAKGRLISLISALSSGNRFVYEYNTPNSFTIDLFNANILSIHVSSLLNNLSLVDSTFQYNDEKDSSTEKYIYNSSGQLAKMIEYNYSAVTGAVVSNEHKYTYDSNGNQLTDTENDKVTTYEYDLTLTNNLSMGLIYYYQNKNLPKKTTVTSGGQTESADHTYTFDDKKRLTDETITTESGDKVKKTYTY